MISAGREEEIDILVEYTQDCVNIFLKETK